MMTKEEKRIRDMRRRWPRIISAAVLVVMFSAALAYLINLRMKLEALVTPEYVSAGTLAGPKAQLPYLFSWFHKLAAYNALLIFSTMFFSCLTGLSLAFIIVEIGDLTNRPILVSMWDRIRRLEEQLGKIREKTEGQQAAGCDSSTPGPRTPQQ